MDSCLFFLAELEIDLSIDRQGVWIGTKGKPHFGSPECIGLILFLL